MSQHLPEQVTFQSGFCERNPQTDTACKTKLEAPPDFHFGAKAAAEKGHPKMAPSVAMMGTPQSALAWQCLELL